MRALKSERRRQAKDHQTVLGLGNVNPWKVNLVINVTVINKRWFYSSFRNGLAALLVLETENARVEKSAHVHGCFRYFSYEDHQESACQYCMVHN